MPPTEEAPLENLQLWGLEGKALRGTRRTPPVNGYFSRVGKCNQTTRYFTIKIAD